MNLVFDYDGTIHDSIAIYEPAFRQAIAELQSRSLIGQVSLSTEEIAYWVGFAAKDMWNSFMPHLSQEVKEDCSKRIGDIMMTLICEGKAQLYPHALEVLGQLREEGHTLLFLSNCGQRYLRAHRNSFPLDEHFSAFYCAEDFSWKPKSDIFSYIEAEQKSNKPYVIIGDRALDIEIATMHGCPSIGCAYGYGHEGELDNADHIVTTFEEIPVILETVKREMK